MDGLVTVIAIVPTREEDLPCKICITATRLLLF